MAAKDANKTRRGTQKVTDLSAKRIAARAAGQTPRCGSPLVGQAGKSNPKLCRNLAGQGTDHVGYGACSRHGGSMSPAKVTAAREAVAVQVDEVKRFYGIKAEVSFEEALLEEMQRSVGVVRWIEEQLSKWESPMRGDGSGRMVWDDETGMPNLLEMHRGHLSVTIADTEHAAWIRQYQIERAHLARVAKMGIDAGVAKGVLMVYARQAETMNLILRETLRRLGIDPADERLPLILPAVIREITGAA